jgi:hypothetical protein
MIGDDRVRIWTAAEVDEGQVPPARRAPVAEILAWARRYLVTSNPGLGRSGPVCPYTQPSLHRGLFHLAALTDAGGADITEAVESLRSWYEKLAAELNGQDRELLTILLVLPHLDPLSSAALDAVQARAKDRFVADGVMIGQFHPACDQPGLWNPHFKALRAPVPLLAIRKLVVFDLPFLMDSEVHAGSYLRRFAPDIPPRIRDQLVRRLTERRDAVRSP